MMDHLLDCTMDHLTIAWWYNYDVWTSQSKSNLSALRWFLKFIIHESMMILEITKSAVP